MVDVETVPVSTQPLPTEQAEAEAEADNAWARVGNGDNILYFFDYGYLWTVHGAERQRL